MLEPLAHIVEVIAGLIAVCFFTTLGVYLYYGGNPPPKIEGILERAMHIFESGADSLFSWLRRDRSIIDVTPEKQKEIEPPKKVMT